MHDKPITTHNHDKEDKECVKEENDLNNNFEIGFQVGDGMVKRKGVRKLKPKFPKRKSSGKKKKR